MSFPRYTEYKDSGVEWLGEVPGHWDVSSFRHCLNQMFNGLTATQVDEAENTVPVTRIETISFGVIDESKLGFIKSDEARADKALLPGDILFSNINSLNMVGKCAFYAGGRTIYAGMNLLVLRPATTKCDPLWLCWLIRSASFRDVVESLAKPAINQASVSQSSINSITVACPPLPEQTQIAAFLDRETAKIDALVAEQRRLMALLKEKRQAVISHAVTRGLNPHALLKPSGIEWLGSVPEHWEVRPLKGLARLQTGMTPPTDNLNNYTDEEGFQWIRPEDLDESGIPTRATKFLTLCGWSLTRHIAAGASLICCIGTIGKVGIINTDASTNQQITSAQPDQDSRYLFYAIRAGRSQLELASTGNVLRILNTERLGNIRFPAPPLAEQAQIAAYLDIESAKFDTLTTEAQRAINLLQERRTALISAAVTGQIDVRSAVASA